MVSTSTSDLKALFVQKRREFKNNPEAPSDLEAYSRHDNAHNYTVIKGLIPTPLVGQKRPGGGAEWHKSDTFFTNFKVTHPEQVLSESEESLVIGNTASHDTRQYLAKWDPDGKDKTSSAGMSYVHLLVIPKKRIYNIVAMDDTAIIDEMSAHFKRFWTSPDFVDKTTVWLKTAVENRAKAVLKSLESHSPVLVDNFENIMKDVHQSAEQLNQSLCSIRSQPVDEVFGFYFHPAPKASIAHLHMHAVLKDKQFREFSTYSHDWKSVPVHDVKEVINGDRERCEETSAKHLWNRILMVPQVLTRLFSMKGSQT